MSERDMARLLYLIERHLGREWAETSEWLRSLPENSAAAIEARIAARDIAGLVREVEAAAGRFSAEAQSAYTRAGREGARWLDKQPALRDKLIRFDAQNDRAVQRARQNQIRLAREMSDDQRQIVRQAMQAGTERAANPREIAREIRDSIGLTHTQAQHVANYRRALESGRFGDAMGRELHDARADAGLRRLQRDGGSLSPAQIDRMTERYRRNYLAYRAETIARTEAARNVHEGLAESFRQAVERGDVEADSLVKEWIPGPAGKDARDDHRASDLLRQRPRVDEPFVLADGTRMMFPGSGPVEHVANCRCTYATTLRA